MRRSFEKVKESLPDPSITEIENGYRIENLVVDGSEPYIVFIHGGLGNLWNPYRQLESLDHGMLTYSIPGYGDSSYRKNQSLKDQVDSLRKLLDKLGIERFVLHGHSYGSVIALEYAKKYNPSGIVISGGGSHHLTPVWEKPLVRTVTRLHLYKLPVRRKVMEKLSPLLFHKDTSEEAVEQFVNSNPIPCNRSEWLTLNNFWGYDGENLDRIDAPTRVLHGGSDQLVSPEAGRKTSEEIPQAEFVDISETGHLPMIEKPEKYNSILERFLKEVGKTG